MGISRTKKKTAARRDAKKPAARPRAKARSRAPAKAGARITIADVAAKLDHLTQEVAALAELLRGGASPRAKAALADLSPKDFDAVLLATVADLDRTARHAGLVPIPEVRRIFLERGWSRDAFDRRLLEAERDFIVDLKAANDPTRLTEPHLAIEQPGRGHLQYVVTR